MAFEPLQERGKVEIVLSVGLGRCAGRHRVGTLVRGAHADRRQAHGVGMLRLTGLAVVAVAGGLATVGATAVPLLSVALC